MFFDELDLLELRLHELDKFVDHFVIVESLERHGSAQSKEAVLKNNWGIVKPFEHKIQYELLDHLYPEYSGSESGWLRDSYNRNMLIQGILKVAAPSDIVMISDCDEIPRMSTVIENIPKIENRLYGLRQDFFYYNVNRYIGEWEWGTVVGTLQAINNKGGVQHAYRAGFDGEFKLKNGGWHFSYFGNIERIKNKVSSITHSQDEPCKAFLARDNDVIKKDILSGIDIYYRYEKPFTKRSSSDASLPGYYLDNMERFKMFTEEYSIQ